MSVELDPTELGFRRPFTSEVAQILKIRNPNNHPVAFKVKTTAPKQYCVRPNSGRIEPDHEVEVQVLLQAMKQDPPADAKCRDKFLVQAVPISGDKEFATVADIWDSVEKSAIVERKIRVTFLPAHSATEAVATPAKRDTADNAVDATPDVPPPSYSSPEQTSAATQPASSPSVDANKAAVKAEPESPSNISSSISAATAQVAQSKPVEQVKEKVAEVKSAVASTVEDSGLKQRKASGTSAVKRQATAPAPVTKVHPAAQQAPQGVPVHMVAALCLVSFLLAYFFF
ncbi:hypothetical protein PpBr36_03024 [Pyricularia pennisetigena]|uniref:hypothetical protein n=1 Tax=Pyricularia pennisetigena TaxID=1578925 RepID=UPI00114E2E7F|nr:hypothetical protein PpBr36_03024 [Pyricularia pennisetigena]TLS31121.1 hypothetical protein PpBr36_03024 [Pyricularia pennisetigena]